MQEMMPACQIDPQTEKQREREREEAKEGENYHPKWIKREKSYVHSYVDKKMHKTRQVSQCAFGWARNTDCKIWK